MVQHNPITCEAVPSATSPYARVTSVNFDNIRRGDCDVSARGLDRPVTGEGAHA